MVAGEYTVQAIVTYSNPVAEDLFPLTTNQLPPPYYEGYFLRDFPLKLNVDPPPVPARLSSSLCSIENLTFRNLDKDLWKRASWFVERVNSHNPYAIQSSNNITLRGHQEGRNSLGFSATFQFENGCVLQKVPEQVSQRCGVQRQPLHIILIGDSVMRLQRDYLLDHLDPTRYKVSFMELYGGYWLCKRSADGPHITDFLATISAADQANTIVLFNTGMHDIHRLCGPTFADERRTYLNATELSLPCTTNYQRAIADALSILARIPAAVRIVQTTHAAWPKFGNYGVAWDPRHGQTLPLDAAFCARFNTVLVQEVVRYNDMIAAGDPAVHMVDTYWMTLARPDNRETNAKNDIGKKLSHPGQEVIQFMVRIWWQAAMQLLGCRPESG